MPQVASGFFEGTTASKGDIKLGIKFDEFSAMLRELRAKLGEGVTMQRVVDHEVARVLEAAIARTGKADRKKIEKRVKRRSVFAVNGKTFGYNPHSKKQWRVSDSVWSEIEGKRERSLARKLAKIGLSKRAWLYVANKAGLRIEKVPAYVEAAATSTRDSSTNANATRQRSGGNYQLEIESKMPVLQWTPPGGTQALFSAIVGRAKFYEQNVAHGVFSDMETIAKKYPGMVTSGTPQLSDPDIPEF